MNFLRLIFVLLTCVALGTSCSPAVSPTGGGAKVIASILPVVGFSNASASRAIVPNTLTTEDINFFVNCPALTGFNTAASGISDGQTLNPQDFLNTTVVFTVSSFVSGVHGISSGVRFSGSLSDGSGTVVVEVNSAGTSFWYEEKIFLDDPSMIVISNHSTTSKSIVHVTATGTINSDHSVIGVSSMSYYTVLGTGVKILAVAPQCEIYLGPWSSGPSAVMGAGTCFLKSSGTTSPTASYASVSEPVGVLDGTKVSSTVEYIEAYKNSVSTFTPQYSIFYKTTNDTHPIQFLTGNWNGVTVNSAALAKANLPSSVWNGYSVVDTF